MRTVARADDAAVRSHERRALLLPRSDRRERCHGRDGSYTKPWRSFANVVTYYGTPGEMGSTARPSTAVDVKPGDYVYLRSGTYDGTYNYAGSIVSLFYRNIDASSSPIHVKAYPGQTP